MDILGGTMSECTCNFLPSGGMDPNKDCPEHGWDDEKKIDIPYMIEELIGLADRSLEIVQIIQSHKPNPKTAEYAIVKNIKNQSVFYTINNPKRDQTKTADGLVTYEIVGYANSPEEAQIKIEGSIVK